MSASPATPEFVVVPSRVVFDAHDEHDRQGQLLRRFGAAELARIAANCNARDAKGAWCPLTIGHTAPGQPEPAQPEAVGYARNWRVASGPSGLPVLLADFHIRADRHAEALTFPRVSVELWPGDDVIDPVALLRRTPRLDIPQWTYSRANGRDVIRYQREATNMPMAAPGPTNVMPPAPPGADTMPPAPPSPPGGGGDIDLEQYMRHCYSHPSAARIYQRYSAGAGGGLAPPPGDPAAPLGADMPPAPPPGAPPEQAASMFQRQNEWLQAQLYARDRELRETLRRGDLGRLAGEGYQFDLEQELADAVDLAPAQYARHLQRIKDHYQRDPATMPLVPTDGPAPTVGGGVPAPVAGPRYVENGALTREGSREVQRYMREHPELTYESAREAFIKQHSTRNGR